jgi:competence protein ComEA
MTDRAHAPPGTIVVAALLAAGLGATAWLRLGRVPVGAGGTLPEVRLDINRATATELLVLPGIGEALAGRVVADREARGPFPTVTDLDRVPGVSATTVERVAPYLVAGPG